MNARRVLISNLILLLATGGCSASQNGSIQSPKQNSEIQIITLTQTGCQFLETESQDYHFNTTQPEDCQQINAQTLNDRQQSFQPLYLKSGEYIFLVTNQDIPYELGFYLRGEEMSEAILPTVSGGGINQGETQSYRVTLRPGKYLFSCPLNPTPDYPLVVYSSNPAFTYIHE